MLIFLFAASLVGATAAPVPAGPTIDTVTVERLIRAEPRRIPLKKYRMLSAGPVLVRTIDRLEQAGFSQLTPEAMIADCGNAAPETYNRLSIRVHDETGWHAVLIPDDCRPSAPDRAKRLDTLRVIGRDVLEHVGQR